MLRTFMYDSNTLDSQFSQYTAGRLVAVQHTPFYPGTVNAIQFTEMYSYTQPGQAAKKRLQVTETLPYGQGLTIPRTLNLDATQTYDTEGKMTSVNYPTTYAWNGSSLVPTTGPTYSYQFDPMHRPNVLTDQNSSVIANNVQYGPANQLASISYGGLTETRQYNSMLQMTNLTVGTQLNITYNFPSSTNNGKIISQTDNLSIETVTYQYDSLNRLLSASASGWNQTFGYDGFGNLVSKSGTNSPVLSIGVDPATNRIVSPIQYDANGNQLSGGLSYDPENRLQFGPGVQYAYDSQNKRIWKGTFDGSGNLTAQEAYFYGVGGQKLGTYALTVVQPTNQQPQLADSSTDSAVFFGGKRVLSGGGAFIQDRLGSARRTQSGTAMSFYPYGEDKGTTQLNDQLKFATYTRDTATSLDYADQRYYANNFGRFMTPDPSGDAWDPANPQSWNSYAYVLSDPINLNDPTGLVQCGDLNVIGGGTVGDYLNANNDTGKLTRFVWAEGGSLLQSGGNQDALVASMLLIAQAIENRLAVANGQVAVGGLDGNIYWGNGGTFNGVVTLPASILGYGGLGTSLGGELVRAAAGTSEVGNRGELVDRSALDSSLNVELGDPTRNLPGRVPVTVVGGGVFYVTPECDRAILAMQATNSILGGANFNQQGFFVTSWKQAGHGNTNPDKDRIGSLGTVGGTMFYGVGDYAYLSYPYPPPRPRSPGPGRGR